MFQDLIKNLPKQEWYQPKACEGDTSSLNKALKCIIKHHQVCECCAEGEQNAALAGAVPGQSATASRAGGTVCSRSLREASVLFVARRPPAPNAVLSDV